VIAAAAARDVDAARCCVYIEYVNTAAADGNQSPRRAAREAPRRARSAMIAQSESGGGGAEPRARRASVSQIVDGRAGRSGGGR